jgi:hypothetical protein
MLSLSLYPHHTHAVVVAAPIIIVGTTSFSFCHCEPGLVDSTIDRERVRRISTSSLGRENSLVERHKKRSSLSALVYFSISPNPHFPTFMFLEKIMLTWEFIILNSKNYAKFLRTRKIGPTLLTTVKSSTLFFHFFAGIRHFSTCNYPRVYTLFRPLDMHTLSNRCCHTPLFLMFFYT